ncbi:TlpA family protein disulfide reductase [Flavobacterium limnophilum]|uniref:TlpA family protein disulfide reductase n=1 Tax=Flavobacterium limnophilum TaxID=3003262 RepID=UPI00248242B8|nr:TlpA disulfide reductase family protein [Flavobacterium limnophilum]
MKRTAIIIILVLLNSMGFAQRVIENPEFEVSNSGITHISKIELNKDATRIHIHNKFIPKWWVTFEKDIFIQLDNNVKLNVLDIEGAKFDEKITMPESGEKTIVLVFPPINDNVKKIDYNNEVFGIALVEGTKKADKSPEIPDHVSKWIDDELKKATAKPLANFSSDQFFNESTGRLIGYIKGYDIRLGFKTGIMYTRNDITNEDYPVVIEIHPDGRFEADIPLISPSYSYMVIKRQQVKFYLEPKQTLVMILDWDEFLYADRMRNSQHNFKNITFEGSLAKINEDLIGFNPKAFDYKSFSKKMKTISPQAFKEEEAIDHKKNLENLETYLNKKSISDKAKILIKNKIDLEHANHLFDFVSNRDYYAKEDLANSILKIPVENEYFDFLQKMDLNDQSFLALDDFKIFVNRLEFSKPILVYPKPNVTNTFTPEKTFEQYLEVEKIEITDNDKVLLESAKTKKFESMAAYEEFQKQFSETYKNASKAYSKKYVDPFISVPKPEKVTMEKWQLRDSIVKNVFHLEKNLVYEVIKIRSLDYDIKRSDSENAHAYWNELQKDITHPFLKKEGERIVSKQYPINSFQNNPLTDNLNRKVNINATAQQNKLPEGKATEIFKNIIKKHKGKILFIDFWATTCGPCVAGIKRMKEKRKEYKDNKDFEFVFITDESLSPLEPYNKFVGEQELENIYRLASDDYNYLRQLFKFNGIPHYVVIDKKGEVINDDFPMHNFNSLLNGILEKYN